MSSTENYPINTQAQAAVSSGTPHRELVQPSDRSIPTAFQTAIICVVGCAIAFAFQLNRYRATFFEGEILPSDNDAFYHARRILDTVQDPQAFYQFDNRLHAPDGMLLPWPWGYDYIVAFIVRLAVSAGFVTDPLKALVYVPPFAVILSIVLVTVIARRCELGVWTSGMLVLAVATSPLTQALHGIGCVDHHYAEYIFILGFLAAALSWLQKPDSVGKAAITGLVLGFAPAIHTFLFILQVPLLASLALLWLKQQPPDRGAATSFAVALAIGTMLAVAPSQAFHEGHFEHYYLAWFHVYVAFCTILVVCFLTRLSPGIRGIAALAVVALLLAMPILPQMQHAAGFLADDSSVLRDIGEAKSVWQMIAESPTRVIKLYSGLILLVPFMAVASLVAAIRSRSAVIVLVCVFSAMALALMLAQFRFYYYGSIAMILLPLLVVERLWQNRKASRVMALCAVGLTIVLVAAYVPAVQRAVASESTPGRDPYFILTRLAMPALARACEEDPGIVLAKNNEGHYIRYYTDCSVISNNFLVAPADIQAFYSIAKLFSETPAEVRKSPTPIKYILVRARGSIAMRANGRGYMMLDREDARHTSDPLTDALLWSESDSVDESFELVAEIPAPTKDYPYARIWKIRR